MSRMVKHRPGYHTLGLQIPDGLWDALEKRATETGESATKLLTQFVADGLGYSRDKLPKPKKSGRPPKPKKGK